MSTDAKHALAAPSPDAPRQSAGVSSGTFAMALFLATEAMFFTGLISAFLVLRSQSVVWPPPDQPRLPVGVTGFNTALLLLSGYTMHRAIRALREASGRVAPWLTATAALGTAFLAIQGFEWVRLVGFGLTMSSNIFGGTFYTLVGAHGLHVLGALAALFAVTRRVTRSKDAAGNRNALTMCGMYWTFVVLVWPLLYLLVYQPWAGR